MNIVKKIDTFLSHIALFFIALYQKTLSPDKGLPSLRLKGRICAHEPHCSEYGKECFQRYGFFRGLHYTISRVSSCIPSREKHYDPSTYSVVFFCGAPIGVPFLETLVDDKRFDVTGVVTMSDAPSGRGMKMKANTIKKTALDLGLTPGNIQTPSSLKIPSKKYGEEAKAFHTWLEEKSPDFIVVVAYGKVIPQAILNIPHFGPINVHGSLLPKYRGASPLQSVFLNDEKETGITIMHMSAGLDEGDSISQLLVPLSFAMTVADLIEEFKKVGPAFLNNTLWKYGKGLVQTIPQDNTQATFTKKISKEDALVDIFTDNLDTLWRKYKAYALWPKIYFMHNEKRVIIETLAIDEESFSFSQDDLLLRGNNELHDAVQDLVVKPQGKKSMPRDSFVRGYMAN